MEQHLHFIGIGGIGMSAIAKIMLHNGFCLSGSDVAENRLTRDLAADGAVISYGHDAANLLPQTEAVVYSSAIKQDNPELEAARRRGLPIYRRAEMLAYLMSTKKGIGIAGTHGKTTTSAMIATMLEACDQDPTMIIGGMLPALGGGNAKVGDGACLVAEADESDGTFLLLRPQIAVVTNIEADHLDYYHDLTQIVAAFRQYLQQIPENGFAVVCRDCPMLCELAAEQPCRLLSYALDAEADYRADNFSYEKGYAGADVFYHGEKLGRLQLQVPGRHNILNALAAIAVGRELGLSFEQCAAGLHRFTGTGRRYELMAEVPGLRVIDDYAHHPTEIATTIRAARDQGARRMLAVFQPHRYTRTQAMYREFAQALFSADHILICEVYSAFEPHIPGVSARLISDELKQMGHPHVAYAATMDEALHYLCLERTDEELVLVMGAGNVRTLSEDYARWVKERC